MAERLKERLLDRERLADLVVGPDAYKDLPRILAAVQVWHCGSGLTVPPPDHPPLHPPRPPPSATPPTLPHHPLPDHTTTTTPRIAIPRHPTQPPPTQKQCKSCTSLTIFKK